MRRVVVAAALLAGIARSLAAQGVSVGVGHLLDDGGWTAVHAGVGRPLVGPVGVELQGRYVAGPARTGRRLYGGGLELSLFRDGAGPYLAGGVAAGVTDGGGDDLWSSWSAGGGWALPVLSIVSLSAEAHWRRYSGGAIEGLELVAGLSLGGRRRAARGGGGRRPAITDWWPAGPSSADLVPGSLAFRRARVIEVAREAMGRRYEFGGTGRDGEGFDCSGLIQYAYREVGVLLPRVSVDQARAGREVDRDPARLEPGDILTFSNDGGRVTHVGLYLGDGRFIHSATGGVQVSLLGDDDPAGRWWWRRWVGVRRVLD